MKFIRCLIIIVIPIVCMYCGSKSTESTSSESVSTNQDPSFDSEVLDTILTIHGKDIWVRDEPGIGKVVMSLQDGDQCKITGNPQQFEIIRGQAHQWYPIEFEGNKGWVFGSQTDQKFMSKMITGKSEDELWKLFMETKKGECDLYNKENHDPDNVCQIEEPGKEAWFGKLEDNQIGVSYNHMDPETDVYTNSLGFHSQILFMKLRREVRGNWSLVHNKTLIGFKKNGELTLFIDGPEVAFDAGNFALNGKIEKVIEVAPNEYLLSCYDIIGEVDENGNPSDSQADLISSYNIYYVNMRENTTRMISKLGFTHLIGSAWGRYDSNNDTFASKIQMEYKSDGPAVFSLIQYRSKLEGYPENTKIVPLDTVTTSYYYDTVKRTIISK